MPEKAIDFTCFMLRNIPILRQMLIRKKQAKIFFFPKKIGTVIQNHIFLTAPRIIGEKACGLKES